MIRGSVIQARAQLDALPDKVQVGEEVLITRRGRPAARKVSIPRRPIAFEEPAAFRAAMPPLSRPSAEILRELRDEED